MAPLYIAYQGLAGIRPLAPGFKRLEIRPQLVDLEQPNWSPTRSGATSACTRMVGFAPVSCRSACLPAAKVSCIAFRWKST